MHENAAAAAVRARPGDVVAEGAASQPWIAVRLHYDSTSGVPP